MPFTLVFRRYAPFSTFGVLFAGDYRNGPSVSMQATARTIATVPFAKGSIGSLTGTSSGTEVNALGGGVRKMLGRQMSHVTCKLSNERISKNSISFTASSAGANPMFRLHGTDFAPQIDTFVDFNAEFAPNGVRFWGVVRGDDFPDAEVFVLDSKGTGWLLFDGRTTAGQQTGPFTELFGAHASLRLGTFSCSAPLSPQGEFRHANRSCSVTQMGARPRPQPAAQPSTRLQ